MASRIHKQGFKLSLLPYDSQTPQENWLGASPQEDWDQSFKAMGGVMPDCFVCDHYAIDAAWHDLAKAQTPQVVIAAIDDLANRSHNCDILIDPSPGRKASDHQSHINPEATLLVGLEYALLRPEFSEIRTDLKTPSTELPDVPRILVTFGGGKTDHWLQVTGEALKRIEERHQIAITVLGASDTLVPQFPQGSRFIGHTEDMAQEILQCDIMICGAGGTSWERCCLGKPAVVLEIADNQRHNAKAINNNATGLLVSDTVDDMVQGLTTLLTDADTYRDMAIRCWGWCDGLGAKRVANALLAASTTLKPCTIDDAKFVYDARYAGGAEKYYRNPTMPTYDSHLDWFAKALASPSCQLFIASMGDERLAHIRLDPNPDDPSRAEIGIALAPGARGRGFSVPILKAACEAFQDAGFVWIDAEVHKENLASKTLFERAGFIPSKPKTDGFLSYELALN